jgi:hypothetical protein
VVQDTVLVVWRALALCKRLGIGGARRARCSERGGVEGAYDGHGFREAVVEILARAYVDVGARSLARSETSGAALRNQRPLNQDRVRPDAARAHARRRWWKHRFRDVKVRAALRPLAAVKIERRRRVRAFGSLKDDRAPSSHHKREFAAWRDDLIAHDDLAVGTACCGEISKALSSLDVRS